MNDNLQLLPKDQAPGGWALCDEATKAKLTCHSRLSQLVVRLEFKSRCVNSSLTSGLLPTMSEAPSKVFLLIEDFSKA